MNKFLAIIILFFSLSSVSFAQELKQMSYKGSVLKVEEVSCGEALDSSAKCFQYLVYIDELNQEVETISSMSETGDSKFKIGDKVYIVSVGESIEDEIWTISGFVRESTMLLIVGVFIIISLVIGGRQGLGSLISLAITTALIFGWAVPRMLAGGNIILLGIITVVISLVLTMYISHGFNIKSTIATVSTIIGIVIVGVLAFVFSQLVRVDGTGSEDAFLLLSQTAGSIDLSAVFFVSILIGAMGVLDDVVISQISSIQELHNANPMLKPFQLFSQAMNIGRDHISTMINTLFIAYAGSSLALVMLLTYNSGGIGNVLRTDSIAEEIIRTMAASIGILLVVPISSLLASNFIYSHKNENKR